MSIVAKQRWFEDFIYYICLMVFLNITTFYDGNWRFQRKSSTQNSSEYSENRYDESELYFDAGFEPFRARSAWIMLDDSNFKRINKCRFIKYTEFIKNTKFKSPIYFKSLNIQCIQSTQNNWHLLYNQYDNTVYKNAVWMINKNMMLWQEGFTNNMHSRTFNIVLIYVVNMSSQVKFI